tara:strand:- start:2736 stop:4373 length:1638 start_codon:yes stop_codon:yes gene_type:complete
MDEEQGLQSPIAGSIRGIRRSVSSNIFTGRAVPPPVAQPDPQTTSLLSQNSLTLTSISAQLGSVSEQVRFLNTSLTTIKDNLAISDQIERQREAAKQRRERILAEQSLREGKESQLEKKIQFALLAPVRRVATFAQGILSRLGNFLFILVGGWLTDKMFTLYRIKSEGNIDKLKQFERTFIPNLLLLAGIGTTMVIGIRRILGVVGRLSRVALKIATSELIRRPFTAALNFIRKNIKEFRKVLGNQLKRFFTRGIGGGILKTLGIGGILTGGALAIPGKGGIGQKIMNFFKGAGGKKLITESVEETTKKPGFLRKIFPKGGLGKLSGPFSFIFYALDAKDTYNERREMGQGKAQAISGGIAEAVGSFAGFWAASSLFAVKAGFLLFAPFPGARIIYGVGWLLSGILGAMFGAKAMGMLNDSLFGLFGKNKKNKKEETKVETNENEPQLEVVESVKFNLSQSDSEKNANLIAAASKNKSNIAEEISNYNESPNIINFPLVGAGKKESNLATTGGSSSPSDYLPNIPSSDFYNTSIALSESFYNVDP